MRKQIGEQRYTAANLYRLARTYLAFGDYGQAKEAAQLGLQLSERFGDEVGGAMAHRELGRVEAAQGHYVLALAHFRQGEAMGRKSGLHRLLVRCLVGRGRVELALDHPQTAKDLFDEALQAFVNLGAGHANSLVGTMLGLGWAALALDDLPTAYETLLRIPEMRGCTAEDAMDAAAGLAEVCARLGRPDDAIALFDLVRRAPATAHATRQRVHGTAEKLGLVLPPSSGTASLRNLDAFLASLQSTSP